MGRHSGLDRNKMGLAENLARYEMDLQGRPKGCEPLKEDPAHYDRQCLECHTLKTKSPKAGDGSSCPVAEKNCTSCHMPKIEVKAAHFNFTDHYIRIVRPGEKFPN